MTYLLYLKIGHGQKLTRKVKYNSSRMAARRAAQLNLLLQQHTTAEDHIKQNSNGYGYKIYDSEAVKGGYCFCFYCKGVRCFVRFGPTEEVFGKY